MRKMWSGQLNFGLVSVPVALTVAQDTKDISFKTLCRATGQPIKQKQWSEELGREVTADELTKGYEVAKSTYVAIDSEAIAALTPEQSRSIEVKEFVPLDQIDPILIEKTYYLLPGDAGPNKTGYKLFLGAISRANVGAIVTYALRGKNYLGLVAAHGDVLRMHNLFYAEDIRSDSPITEEIAPVEIDPIAADMADRLVEAMTSEAFYHDGYVNETREKVKDYVAAVVAGDAPQITATATKEQAPTGDLLAALKASVEANSAAKKKRKTPTRTPAKKAARRTPAKAA